MVMPQGCVAQIPYSLRAPPAVLAQSQCHSEQNQRRSLNALFFPKSPHIEPNARPYEMQCHGAISQMSLCAESKVITKRMGCDRNALPIVQDSVPKSKSSRAEFKVISRKISWSCPRTKVVSHKFYIRPGRHPLSSRSQNATPNKINVNR